MPAANTFMMIATRLWYFSRLRQLLLYHDAAIVRSNYRQRSAAAFRPADVTAVVTETSTDLEPDETIKWPPGVSRLKRNLGPEPQSEDIDIFDRLPLIPHYHDKGNGGCSIGASFRIPDTVKKPVLQLVRTSVEMRRLLLRLLLLYRCWWNPRAPSVYSGGHVTATQRTARSESPGPPQHGLLLVHLFFYNCVRPKWAPAEKSSTRLTVDASAIGFNTFA